MSTKIINMMRARFWELDDSIKRAEAKLEPLNAQVCELGVDLAKIREKKKAIGARKKKIIADSDLFDMCKERSGCSGFLKGKTGVHP